MLQLSSFQTYSHPTSSRLQPVTHSGPTLLFNSVVLDTIIGRYVHDPRYSPYGFPCRAATKRVFHLLHCPSTNGSRPTVLAHMTPARSNRLTPPVFCDKSAPRFPALPASNPKPSSFYSCGTTGLARHAPHDEPKTLAGGTRLALASPCQKPLKARDVAKMSMSRNPLYRSAGVCAPPRPLASVPMTWGGSARGTTVFIPAGTRTRARTPRSPT